MDPNAGVIKKIFDSASSIFEVGVEDIRSKSRIREVVDARKAIVYILSRDLKKKPGQIAKMLNKNHCTMNYMLAQSIILIKQDSVFKTKVYRIRAETVDSNSCPCCGRPYDR